MHRDRHIETLVLDLEGTLISNALSQIPRPGLLGFLEFCRPRFPRIVVYTGVREQRFRKVAFRLIVDGFAPRWFGNVAHFYWSREYKDLRDVVGPNLQTTAIVDDMEECIHPDQRDLWIPIEAFERPYPESDRELDRLKQTLEGLTDASL
jgi:hypothetical protein